MDIIKGLLNIGAIRVNIDKPFVWTSGIKSPIYCDNRKSLGHYDLRHAIAVKLAELIKERFPGVEIIGGTATAGIPHATSVADILRLPLVYFRSKAKEHGTTSVIEGDYTKGAKIVIIEDLISTGGSVLRCAGHARDAGLEVTGVAAIFDYQLKAGRDNFADAKIPLEVVTDFADLEKELNLSPEQAEFLAKWRM
ncbi:MAG: orotate phosphoribosyltransferase, partial [Methylobacteriaceae bacterium]|nr:orotate phosphoribosyltransferase [Methylobacteriaceae bacterium]